MSVTPTYVSGTVYDADSHIMELPDWLESYAEPGVRDRIRPLYLGGAGSWPTRPSPTPSSAAATRPRRFSSRTR